MNLKVADDNPASFVAFFESIAEDWEGWSETRGYESLDGTLRIAATHDRIGAVRFEIKLRGDASSGFDWSASHRLSVKAGDLGKLAAAAKAFAHDRQARPSRILVLVWRSPLRGSVTTATAAAQDERPAGYVGRSSFWIDIPRDWKSLPEEASERKAIFILTPAGDAANAPPLRIVGSSHRNATITEVLEKARRDMLSQNPGAGFQAPSVLGIGNIQATLVEVHGGPDPSRQFQTIALVPLQTDVVVITLTAASEAGHKRGHEALLELLESFAAAGAGPG